MRLALVRWLLHLYPPAWRHQYGREFLAHLETERPTAGVVLDVALGALDARLQRQFRAPGQRPILLPVLVVLVAVAAVGTAALEVRLFPSLALYLGAHGLWSIGPIWVVLSPLTTGTVLAILWGTLWIMGQTFRLRALTWFAGLLALRALVDGALRYVPFAMSWDVADLGPGLTLPLLDVALWSALVALCLRRAGVEWRLAFCLSCGTAVALPLVSAFGRDLLAPVAALVPARQPSPIPREAMMGPAHTVGWQAAWWPLLLLLGNWVQQPLWAALMTWLAIRVGTGVRPRRGEEPSEDVPPISPGERAQERGHERRDHQQVGQRDLSGPEYSGSDGLSTGRPPVCPSPI